MKLTVEWLRTDQKLKLRSTIRGTNYYEGCGDMKMFLQAFRSNRAATAIEYGLIAALIAVAAISAMQGLGNHLKTTFTNVSSNMKAT